MTTGPGFTAPETGWYQFGDGPPRLLTKAEAERLSAAIALREGDWTGFASVPPGDAPAEQPEAGPESCVAMTVEHDPTTDRPRTVILEYSGGRIEYYPVTDYSGLALRPARHFRLGERVVTGT